MEYDYLSIESTTKGPESSINFLRGTPSLGTQINPPKSARFRRVSVRNIRGAALTSIDAPLRTFDFSAGYGLSPSHLSWRPQATEWHQGGKPDILDIHGVDLDFLFRGDDSTAEIEHYAALSDRPLSAERAKIADVSFANYWLGVVFLISLGFMVIGSIALSAIGANWMAALVPSAILAYGCILAYRHLNNCD